VKNYENLVEFQTIVMFMKLKKKVITLLWWEIRQWHFFRANGFPSPTLLPVHQW